MDLRALRAAAIVETASLAVLLVNLATVHWEPLASALGPLHGTAYLATIAIGLLLPVPRAARWLTVVPGVGGWLALRRLSRLTRRSDPSR